MSQVVRQSNLFAGEDFVKVYKTFQDIDFTAYDFDTIRDAMITYIRAHYPEDFNDYVESSEFIAIIELLAFLGTSLAFRADLNSRENVLDTAERRESIIRLARMINYSPSRNIPARGLFKLEAVSTNQPLIDSEGINISNTPIFWGDPNNNNWFDQFIQILNNSFNPTNLFGRPSKSGTVADIPTDLYEMSNVLGLNVAYNVNLNVNGEIVPVDIVNPDFDLNFEERHPDQNNPFHLIYRNDSLGVSSNNTGFFVYFKQGTLTNQDDQYDFPVPNRVTDIVSENINQTDVYVQEVSDTGTVVDKWTSVPAVTGTNIIYNSITSEERNIFEVISDTNDSVSIKYADGNFGNIPTGIFRTWYRTSLNRNLVIRPEDAQGVQITLPYTGVDNQEYSLTLKFSLKETVSNGATSETNGQIKLRAPQAYYTQERMVNNEDYNVFPLIYGNQISKLRSINRTYAGHSRYIDVNDPTGFHRNLILLGEDGALYQSNEEQRTEVDTSDDEVVYNTLQQFVSNDSLESFFYSDYITQFLGVTGNPDYFSLSNQMVWKTSPDKSFNDTGYFEYASLTTGDPINNYIPLVGNPNGYITSGSVVIFDNNGVDLAAVVKSVRSGGKPANPATTTLGPVELSAEIQDQLRPLEVKPNFRTTFNNGEMNAIKECIATDGGGAFGLGYDLGKDEWRIIENPDITNPFELHGTTDIDWGDDSNARRSWLVMLKSPTNEPWEILTRGNVVIFESLDSCRFYWDPESVALDSETGQSLKDTIEILPHVNTDSNNNPLDHIVPWELSGVFIQKDGFQDAAKIELLPADLDEDGTPDVINSFDKIVGWSDSVVFETYLDLNGYEKSRAVLTGWRDMTSDGTITADIDNLDIVGDITGAKLMSYATLYQVSDEATLSTLIEDVNNKLADPLTSVAALEYVELLESVTFQIAEFSIKLEKRFQRFGTTVTNGVYSVYVSDDSRYYELRGKSFTQDTNKDITQKEAFVFKWNHYAPTQQRIDPAPSNIIDMLIVTSLYYQDVLTWKDEGGTSLTFPAPPTTEELRTDFVDLDKFKTTSDQIVFNSGKFKVLFGTQAESELQATFKAVKILTTSISDSELKTNIINAIDEYFNINNWDFGETFFYTELAAYIHTQLSKYLSSIVIVPTSAGSEFGNLFEIVANPDELFLSTATVANVEIVKNFTETNLRL